MRKRKSPVGLLTALGVVVAVVIGVNLNNSLSAGKANEPAPPPQVEENAKPIGAPRPSSGSSVADQVKGAMSSPKGGAEAEPTPMRGGPGGGPDGPGQVSGPLIMNPNRPVAPGKAEKPKPNPTSTSTQWYNDESALGAGDN